MCRSLAATLPIVLVLFACSGAPEQKEPEAAAPPTPEEARAIAKEAYTYAFPMMMGYRSAFGTFLWPSLPSYLGPPNTMLGEPRTLDHTYKDVISPNADTPYSPALLDLRAGPLVLQVPEVKDRYYGIQFVDLYGHNPHYVGTRATGSQAGTYLLAGPNWNGKGAEGFDEVLRFETDLVLVIGRTQLFGQDDLAALAEVMKAYTLSPLAEYRGGKAPVTEPVDWMVWNDEASRDERFSGYLNFLLQFCQPPHPSEVDMLERFVRIGIGPGVPFLVDGLETDLREALRSGVEEAREQMMADSKDLGKLVNGWMMTDAFGDRDFYQGDHDLRAAAAMMGWGGNDKIEAFYPIAQVDSAGNPLNGAHTYRLTLTGKPPVKAFWSVTMYDTSYDGAAGYLVENPIGRYLINSTTEGLVRGKDGSLDIYIQHDEPKDPSQRANWLPAPEGDFYLAFRLYHPEPAALDGSWLPPPVVRTDG